MADNPEPFEIIQMARYLEIDPIYDSKYLWIANEAVVNTASLPEGWEEHSDDEGNTYFYNSTTDTSAWEHPLDQHYRDLFREVKQLDQEAEERDHKKALHKAAILIQRNFRGFLDRKKIKPHKDEITRKKLNKYATFMQAGWRGYVARRYRDYLHGQNEYRRANTAANTVQRCYRGHKGRAEYGKFNETRLRKRKATAAMRVQSLGRAWRDRRALKYGRENKAARPIQAAFRGYLTRRWYKAYLRRRLMTKAAMDIQKIWRGYSCRSKAVPIWRRKFEREHGLDTAAFIRERSDRRAENKQHTALSTIQRKFRKDKFENNAAQDRLHTVESQAVTKIQSAFRSMMAKNNLQLMRLTRWAEMVNNDLDSGGTGGGGGANPSLGGDAAKVASGLGAAGAELESLGVRMSWVVSGEDKQHPTSMAHYFFRKGNTRAAVHYLQKALTHSRVRTDKYMSVLSINFSVAFQKLQVGRRDLRD
jgi:hypothetical protein